MAPNQPLAGLTGIPKHRAHMNVFAVRKIYLAPMKNMTPAQGGQVSGRRFPTTSSQLVWIIAMA